MMITNERQYRIATTELRRFEEALVVQQQTGPSPGVDRRIHQALQEATASDRDERAGSWIGMTTCAQDESRSGR